MLSPQFVVRILPSFLKEKAYKRTIFDYKHASYEGLRHDLSTMDWNSDVFNNSDINDLLSKFQNVYTYAFPKASQINK